MLEEDLVPWKQGGGGRLTTAPSREGSCTRKEEGGDSGYKKDQEVLGSPASPELEKRATRSLVSADCFRAQQLPSLSTSKLYPEQRLCNRMGSTQKPKSLLCFISLLVFFPRQDFSL